MCLRTQSRNCAFRYLAYASQKDDKSVKLSSVMTLFDWIVTILAQNLKVSAS